MMLFEATVVGRCAPAPSGPRRCRPSAGPEAVHLAPQALGGKHVQGAERLVHAEQFRPAGQRPGDTDPLLHAAGQFLGERLLVALQPDHLHAPRDPPVGAASGRRPRPFSATSTFCRTVSQGNRREALEYDRDAGVNACQRPAVGEHLPAGRFEQADEYPQQRALAAAAGARGSRRPRRGGRRATRSRGRPLPRAAVAAEGDGHVPHFADGRVGAAGTAGGMHGGGLGHANAFRVVNTTCPDVEAVPLLGQPVQALPEEPVHQHDERTPSSRPTRRSNE